MNGGKKKKKVKLQLTKSFNSFSASEMISNTCLQFKITDLQSTSIYKYSKFILG